MYIYCIKTTVSHCVVQGFTCPNWNLFGPTLSAVLKIIIIQIHAYNKYNNLLTI